MVKRAKTLILGASTGLGSEIAQLCLQRGEETIEVSLEKVSSPNSYQDTYLCDLADETSVTALLTALSEKKYNLSHFFWVAGTLWRGTFLEQSDEELRHIIDVNIRNSILVASWAYKAMAQNTTPSTYTVVSSASGVRTYEDFLKYTKQVSYVTTKYAQVGFTRALAAENTNRNLRFSLILPDGMNTPMRRHFKPDENINLLDPAVVAHFLFDKVMTQTTPYFEEFIAKGSLDTYATSPAQTMRQRPTA